MPLFDIFASPRWPPLRKRTKVASFFIFFQELLNKKKIKALWPKMTKIASRGSCLKTFSPKILLLWKKPGIVQAQITPKHGGNDSPPQPIRVIVLYWSNQIPHRSEAHVAEVQGQPHRTRFDISSDCVFFLCLAASWHLCMVIGVNLTRVSRWVAW